MKKANKKLVKNQQVNNNGCQHVQLGGVAYYDDKQYFLFSPDSVNQGVVEAFRRHGEDTEQGHETGVDCAPLPLFARLPLPQECERAAGHAGHRVAQVWHRDFHTRLFLARARGGRSYSPFQQ